MTSPPAAVPPGDDVPPIERVRAVVRSIPPGEWMTYGEVAEEAGLRSARQVGHILARHLDDVPWHRVLRAGGRPAPHIEREQLARLRAEGVQVVDGRARR